MTKKKTEKNLFFPQIFRENLFGLRTLLINKVSEIILFHRSYRFTENSLCMSKMSEASMAVSS